ncbi:MAG: hypothetical protein AAFX93_03845 [Verrucomicrobiota bacterium]
MSKYYKVLMMLCALGLGGAVFGSDDLVTLRNFEGREIQCSIVGCSNGMVSLKRQDGMAFKYPMEDLDEASKQVVVRSVQQNFVASIEVKSIKTSSRVTKSYSSGNEYRHGTKNREFEVKVKTFAPFKTKVIADCFFYKGSKWGRKKIEGYVKDDIIWKFEVGDSTSWREVHLGGAYKTGRATDYRTGSARIDLVIYLRKENGEIIDSYTTSRFAEQEIEEKVLANE